MPRRTPVNELLKEETAVPSSPLRRSSRISNNSPVPTKVTTRRSSASETTTSTPKATRGRRSSFSQELEGAKENETENKTTKATSLRTRRGSLSSKNNDDSVTSEENSGPKRVTRASSVAKDETSDIKGPVTRRRRSVSQEVEINDSASATKITRARSKEVPIKKNEKSEDKVVESEVPVSQVSTPMKNSPLESIKEVTKESDSPVTNETKTSETKKKKLDNLKVDLDLSVIKEASFTAEDISEEENRFVPLKDESTKEDRSEVRASLDSGEKNQSESLENKKITEESTEVKPIPDVEKKNSSDADNVIAGKVIEVSSPKLSNEKSFSEEKSITPKKEADIGENESAVASSINLQDSTTDKNKIEIISPQGNKENICPKNKPVELECEPMEVDEPDIENSYRETLSKGLSPIPKISKAADISRELEITGKVTDEIDQFLKEDVRHSLNLSNKTKKNRLSLNHSSSTSSHEKEALTDEPTQNNTMPEQQYSEQSLTKHEEKEHSATEPILATKDVEKESEECHEKERIKVMDNQEAKDQSATATEPMHVSKNEEEAELVPEKEKIEVSDNNAINSGNEDSEDSFHLELTETKSLNDTDKIENNENASEIVQDNESPTINEDVTMRINEKIPFENSVTEKDTQKDINLEVTGKDTMNNSKVAEDDENRAQENDQNSSTSTNVESIVEKVKLLFPIDNSTPKANSKEVNPENASHIKLVEVEDDLKIQNSDISPRDTTEVGHGVQQTFDLNNSSCSVANSENDTNEDSKIQSTFRKEEVKTTNDTEPEEELEVTEKSMQKDEIQESNNKEDIVENNESIETVKNCIDTVESVESVLNTSIGKESSQNTSLNRSHSKVEKENVDMEKMRTETLKKSPVNVIIKSDILIQSAFSQNDSFEKLAKKSVSPKENRDLPSKKSETSVEANLMELDDNVFEEEYKSPKKKVKSKSQSIIDCTKYSSSSSNDELEIEQSAEKKKINLIESKYEIVSNEKAKKETVTNRTERSSVSSDEIIILSDNEGETYEEGKTVTEKMENKQEDVIMEKILVGDETEIKIIPNQNNCNESTVTDDNSKLEKHSPDKSLIVMHQTIKPGDFDNMPLNESIHQVIESFCKEIKDSNNVTVNVSLEFTGYFSDSDNETTSKKDTSAAVEDSEQVVEQSKRSKRRKLYHSNGKEYLNADKSSDRQELQEDLQEKSNETNMDKKVESKLKPKKSATFDESSSPQTFKESSEISQDEDKSPMSKSRRYKDTPYKSLKSSKKSSVNDTNNKKDTGVELDDESPNVERQTESSDEEEEVDEQWNLFKEYFSSVSEANDDIGDDFDSTWGPSREITSSDSDLSSDELEDTQDLSIEEESLFIKSPISATSLRDSQRRKTESSGSNADCSEEPSFTYNIKSTKLFKSSPKSHIPETKKSPTPTKNKKRRSFQSETKSEDEEDEKIQVENVGEEKKRFTQKKRHSRTNSTDNESLVTNSSKSPKSPNTSSKSPKSLKTSPKSLVSENITFKINSPSPSKNKNRKSLQSETKPGNHEKVEEILVETIGKKKEKKIISQGGKTLETIKRSKVEKTSLKENKNCMPLKPSTSSLAAESTTGGKKLKKRTHPISEEIVEAKRPFKSRQVPEIIVKEVPTSKLKVSTKECMNTGSNSPAKKSRKTPKTKWLKPSCVSASGWEVKKIK